MQEMFTAENADFVFTLRTTNVGMAYLSIKPKEVHEYSKKSVLKTANNWS